MMKENAPFIMTFLIGNHILYSLEPANQRDELRKHQLDGCLIHIVEPNLSGVNLRACGIRIGLS